ncbi:hypothetical protein ARMSODRAFT_1026046 [Armillaria solidipes]|uniref:Uncharacterized protein n=1 Tax=Armillaria solidipes TaxID=1076256 RepID=A0A2H3AQ76_9AGAR|nr:hypothetical protein ARMSODRAFT_1026046 [Armillaria solidipes]
MATLFYNPFEDPQHPPTTPEYKTEVVNPLLFTDGQVERPKKSWFLHILCFTLHAVLIGLHVLLLFVWFTRFEHKVVVPIGQKSNILSTVIVQVSQLFATIYLSILIFISQQLATRRNLHTRQTLTATHDNMSAWTGLGAALMALWRQTTIAATVAGVFLVSAYFVCAGILSVTAPALFSLQPFNTSRHSVISTTLGPPNISINNLGSSNPSSFWLDSTPVIPYLSHSDRISKIGLENGTLYDVLSNNNGEGDVFVNALTFNVTCGFVDGVSITPIPNTGNWSVDTVYDDHVQPIPVLAPNTFKWLPYYNYNFRDPWRHALFYTSANITDSDGSKGNLVSLKPPMQPGTYMSPSRKIVNYFDEATVYTMQVIGCTITLINQTAVVDAQSHLLKRVYPSGRKTSSTWSQWNPETIPANATVSSSPDGATTIFGRDAPTATPTPVAAHSKRQDPPAGARPTQAPQPQSPNPEPATPNPPPPPQNPNPQPATPPSNPNAGGPSPQNPDRQPATPPQPHPAPQNPSTQPASPPESNPNFAAPQDPNPQPAPVANPPQSNSPANAGPAPQQARPAPQPQAQPAPQSQPQPQSNPQPQAQPQPAPQPQPNPQPATNSNSNPEPAPNPSPQQPGTDNFVGGQQAGEPAAAAAPNSNVQPETANQPAAAAQPTVGNNSPTTASEDTATRGTGAKFGSLTWYSMSNVFLDVWWNLFDQAATSRFPSTDDCPGFPWSNPDICNPLTVVEQFVMEDLGLHSILLDSPVRPAPVITLHDLENSIASATAASYWAVLYAKAGGLKNDDPYNVDNVNNFKVEAMAGNAAITYPYTAMRLNINLIPVAVGLGASIGLLVLAYQLIGKPIAGDSGVDTIGVLQILWLMRTRPDLQRLISEVDEPSVDNLRRTGMVNTLMHSHGEESRALAPE